MSEESIHTWFMGLKSLQRAVISAQKATELVLLHCNQQHSVQERFRLQFWMCSSSPEGVKSVKKHTAVFLAAPKMFSFIGEEHLG